MADDANLGINITGDASQAELAATGLVGTLEELIAAIRASSLATAESVATDEAKVGSLGALADAAAATKDFLIEMKNSIIEAGEALIGFFALEQLGAFVEKTAEAAEQQQHMAQELGISQKEWQGLSTVAQLTGHNADTLGMSLVRLERNLVMGGQGAKLQGAALKSLGIDARDTSDPLKLILQIADKFHGTADGMQKNAVAMALMGRAGAQMVPVLDLGSAAIKDMIGEGEKFGTVMSDDMNASMVKLAETQNKLHAAWDGMWGQLLARYAPQIEGLIGNIISLIEAFKNWALSGDNLKKAIDTVIWAVATLGTTMMLGVLLPAVNTVASEIAEMGKVFFATAAATDALSAATFTLDAAMDANPIGAILAAVGLLIGAFMGLYPWLVKVGAIEWLGNAWNAAWGVAAAALKLVVDYMRPIVEFLGWILGGIGKIIAQPFVAWWKALGAEIDWAKGGLGHVVEELGKIPGVSKIVPTLKDWWHDLGDAIGGALKALHDWLEAHFPDVMQAWDKWVNKLHDDIDGLTAAFQKWAGIVSSPPMPSIGPALQKSAAEIVHSGTQGKKPPIPPFTPGGSHGEGQIGKWEEELHQQEIDAAQKTGDYLKDNTQMEMDYWTTKLGLVKAKSKEWYEIQAKIYELAKQLASQRYQEDIANNAEAMERDRGVRDKEIADWKDKLAIVAKAHTENSAEYKQALREMAAAERQWATEDMATTKAATDRAIQEIQRRADATKAQFTAQEANVQDKQDLGEINPQQAQAQMASLHQQEIAAEVATEQQIFGQREAMYARLKELAKDNAAEYAKIVQEETTMEAEHADKIVQLNSQALTKELQDQNAALKQMKSQWDSVMDPLVNTFTHGLLEMAEGTKSFGQVLKSMGQQIVNDFINNVVNKKIEAWLWGEAMQTTRTAAGATTRAAIENTSYFTFMAGKMGALLGIHTATEAGRTTATAAGATARAGIENAGFIGKVIMMLASLLGIHIGHEAAKTAATATAAGARAAAETIAAMTAAAAQKLIYAQQAVALVGLAGAGGVASMAAAPFPIDMGAPEFGAAMAMAASGFAGMASAAGGFDIPLGDNPVTQLHSQEMVLPAHLANPLRSFLAGAQAGDVASAISSASKQMVAGGGAGSAGDTHLHYNPTIHAGTPDLMDLVEKQSREFVGYLGRQMRSGHLRVPTR